MQEYFESLSRIPLFKNIKTDDTPIMLKKLNAYTREYKKNEYIKNTGDKADFIGLVLEGNIQIISDDYYGNRSIIANIEKRSLFAETFALSKKEFLPVDIISCDKTKILFINIDNLLKRCSAGCEFHHILINNLLSIIVEKNIFLKQKLRYSSHKTTAEKIMAFLSDQAKQNNSSSFVIPFNRQELADYLGVERSAMSTEINKLVKNNIIETNRSYFKILKTINE